MNYAVTQIRKQGRAHKNKHKPCQDYCMTIKTDDKIILLAADGHGGKTYARSQLGSRIVCSAAAKLLLADTPSEDLPRLLKNEYDRIVYKHLALRPPTKTERELLESFGDETGRALYGTTFLGAVLDDSGCTAYRLGDGEIHIMKRNGTFFSPLKDDPACTGRTTSSMIYPLEKALEHFYTAHYDEPCAAVFMFTDGYKHILSRPYDALRLLDNEANGMTLEDVLKRGDRKDDQTFIFVRDESVVHTHEFAHGLSVTRSRGAFEKAYCTKVRDKLTELYDRFVELRDELSSDSQKLKKKSGSNPDAACIADRLTRQIVSIDYAQKLLEYDIARWSN